MGESYGVLPEQPRSRLRVRLVPDEASAPLPRSAALWQLDAPPDEETDSGDLEHATAAVSPDGTLTFEDIPAGRYRLFVRDQALGSDDPPDFRMTGSDAEVALVVTMPRAHPVSLEVYDEDGRLLREESSTESVRGPTQTASRPAWARARISRRDGIVSCRSIVSCGPCGSRSVMLRAVRGRNPVVYHRAAEVTAPQRYVARAVPLALLADRVRLADGRRAVDAGASVHGTCRAELLPEGAELDIPSVHVTVTLDGYTPVEFLWGHHPGRPIVMAPR